MRKRSITESDIETIVRLRSAGVEVSRVQREVTHRTTFFVGRPDGDATEVDLDKWMAKRNRDAD